MQRAGMNMVRVWAGGVYPPDAFFHACDTAGILVWQDFMFGYLPPGDGPNLERSLPELREQVSRLWNHPSLALFCGNNELDVALKNWGWQKTYKLEDQRSKRIDREYAGLFDQRAREIAEWASLYTPTSPLSNWGDAEGLRNGDLHYWGVWHGDEPFSSFGRNVGRFVSEYGFQSYPDSATLATQLDPVHLYLGSPMLAKRQKSYKGDAPIWTAIEREFGVKPRTLGEFILFSQLAQAEGYRQAIWAHVTGQPHCMGTLFWQLNDVWAGPSWSTVDHTGTWKAAMYEVARSYAPCALNLGLQGDSLVATVWNERQDLKKAQVLIQVIRTDGTIVRTDSSRIVLGTGERTILAEPVEPLLGGGAWDHHVVRVALQDGAGAVVVERLLPLKHLGEMAWEKATVRAVKVSSNNAGTTYRLTTDKPVPVVKLEARGGMLSDNYFPLCPGTSRTVTISGSNAAPGVTQWP
jgi:beta-mannosidase